MYADNKRVGATGFEAVCLNFKYLMCSYFYCSLHFVTDCDGFLG